AFTAPVGSVQAILSVSAVTGGTPAPITLTGMGAGQATLSANPFPVDLGNIEVGVLATSSVVITNTGNGTTGIPRVFPSNTELSVASNGCTTAMAPGTSCTVGVGLTAAETGVRSGILTVEALPATVSVAVNGTAAARVTVAKSGTGTGTVTS